GHRQAGGGQRRAPRRGDRWPGAARRSRAVASLASGANQGSAGEHRPVSLILPGATIGILGGGQLGPMTAMPARPLGDQRAVLAPDPSCAARFLVETCVTAAFDDVEAARSLAQRCQVATVEIEKISIEVMEAVQQIIPMRPGPGVLHIVQDRARQKDWLAERGFPVGPYRKASTENELREAAQALGGRG